MVATTATWSQVHKMLTQEFLCFMDEYSASKHFEPLSFLFRITFSFLSTGTLSSGKSPSPPFFFFFFLYRPEAKKISVHHAPASHFESRGESPSSRQAAKILKRQRHG
ncbi:hypothetical protein AVEN_115466-1 [Araneus ventricosus]|uniref:Uncharacterized protein n=1 Tax=Araneus ventricosus TaxID=182803 RepID=A0A4Y2JZ41_ARAVE|nr:hypothetical protein AVEN_115466-1 [Araneus ventricosus]